MKLASRVEGRQSVGLLKMEYFMQNFNWYTFFVALGFFVLVSSLYNIVLSYFSLRKARRKSQEADAILSKLQQQLKGYDQKLDDLISKKREMNDQN